MAGLADSLLSQESVERARVRWRWHSSSHHISNLIVTGDSHNNYDILHLCKAMGGYTKLTFFGLIVKKSSEEKKTLKPKVLMGKDAP